MTIDAIGFAEKMHAAVQAGEISTQRYGASMKYLAQRLYPDLDEAQALAKLFTTAAGRLYERPFTSPMSAQQNYAKSITEGVTKIDRGERPAAPAVVKTEAGSKLDRLVKRYAEDNGMEVSAAWGKLDQIPGHAELMAADRAERLAKYGRRGGEDIESYAMSADGDSRDPDAELNDMADAHQAEHNKAHPKKPITFEQAHTHVALNDPRGAKLFRQSKLRAMAKNATA